MPKTAIIVKRVPMGSPAPDGFTKVRDMPRFKVSVYQKIEQRDTPDELADLFGKISFGSGEIAQVVNDAPAAAAVVQQIQNTDEDQLAAMLGAMGLGGRRKTRGSRRGVKKTRKSKGRK